MIYGSREEWRVYPHNNRYEVSTLGRIRRARKLGNFHKHGMLMLCPKSNGYLIVSFVLDGFRKRRTYSVHRIILETFVGDRPDKMECNHKNGRKYDNSLSNLEWTTSSYNKIHAYKTGLHSQSGVKNNYSKLTEGDVVEIRRLRGMGWLLREIGTLFNINTTYVFNVVKGITWGHVGGIV